MNYKIYSLVQSLIIFICGLSVVEYGTNFFNLTGDGLSLINSWIFDNGGTFWNEIVFWGYCFIIVAIVQLLKSFTKD